MGRVGDAMEGVGTEPFDADKARGLREHLERRVRRQQVVVVLLGAGGRGLASRRRVAAALRRLRFTAVVPEDDLPPDIAPSVAEEAMIADDGTDLVFLQVGSWGSATEFGQLRANPRTARKLRVLVPPSHHPVYGDRRGYLADLYLTHLALHGHVYATGRDGRLRVPKTEDLIVLLAERYRQAVAFVDK